MFGTILKLDCKRQNRVNPNGFLNLFKESNRSTFWMYKFFPSLETLKQRSFNF